MYRQFFSQIAVVQKGKETLPRCDLCDMHIPTGRLINYQRTQRCDRNTHMRWRRRNVASTSRYTEASFIPTREDEVEFIDGLDTLKYLGRMLDRSDDNWPAVRRNFGKAPQVWIRIRKLLRRERENPRVSEMFYRILVQAVLPFGAETWVLLAAMSHNIEEVHVDFLRQMTGKKEKQQRNGT